jgi:hypothetical protein
MLVITGQEGRMSLLDTNTLMTKIVAQLQPRGNI